MLDAIVIFFVILGSLAGLAAAAGSFGADSRDLDPNARDHRA